jgi:hypothetical protein
MPITAQFKLQIRYLQRICPTPIIIRPPGPESHKRLQSIRSQFRTSRRRPSLEAVGDDKLVRRPAIGVAARRTGCCGRVVRRAEGERWLAAMETALFGEWEGEESWEKRRCGVSFSSGVESGLTLKAGGINEGEFAGAGDGEDAGAIGLVVVSLWCGIVGAVSTVSLVRCGKID